MSLPQKVSLLQKESLLQAVSLPQKESLLHKQRLPQKAGFVLVRVVSWIAGLPLEGSLKESLHQTEMRGRAEKGCRRHLRVPASPPPRVPFRCPSRIEAILRAT